MTSTIERENVHYAAGYAAPAWATDHEIDHQSVLWERKHDTSIEYIGAANPDAQLELTITRDDVIQFDGEQGWLRVWDGATLIHICDDVSVTSANARKLAQELIRLADIAEAS